jgi:hypothetical protein
MIFDHQHLPIKPIICKIPEVYWLDNLDMNIEEVKHLVLEQVG